MLFEHVRLKSRLLGPALLAVAAAATTALAVTLQSAHTVSVPGGVARDVIWISDTDLLSAADTRVVMIDAAGTVKRIFQGASDSIESVLISPDRRWVAATTSFGRELVLWDASTGRVIQRLRDEDLSAGFVADGSLLVQSENGLKLLNPLNGQRQSFPNPLKDDLWEVVTSADGQRVALRGEDRVIVLEASGSVVRELRTPGVTMVRFSADHSWLAAIGEDDAVALHLPTGRTIKVPDSSYSDQFTFIRNEGLILLNDGAMSAVDLVTGESHSIPVGTRTALALDANSSGNLAIGTYSGVWAGTGEESALLPLPATSVFYLGWQGGQFVTLNLDDQLIDEHGRPISPFIKRVGDLASTSASLWVSTRTAVAQVRGGQLNVVATLPDAAATDDRLNLTEGGVSAVLVRDRKLTVVTPGKATITPNLSNLSGEYVVDGALSSDGKTLNVLQNNAVLSEYTLATSKVRPVVDLPGLGLQLAVSRGGTRAALHVVQGKYTLSLLPPGATKPSRSLVLPSSGMKSDLSLRFSPDGKRLAVINQGLNVWLLDTATLGVLAKYGPLADRTQALAWSADGKQLAVGAGGPNDTAAITVLDVK